VRGDDLFPVAIDAVAWVQRNKSALRIAVVCGEFVTAIAN